MSFVGHDDFLVDLFPWSEDDADTEDITASQMSPIRPDEPVDGSSAVSVGSSSRDVFVPGVQAPGTPAVPAAALPVPLPDVAESTPLLPEAGRKRLRSKTPRPVGFAPPPPVTAAPGSANRLSLPPSIAAAGGLGVGGVIIAAVPSAGASSTATPRRQSAAPGVQTPGIGIWAGYENMTFSGHRAKYFYVYKKLRHWLSVKVNKLSDREIQLTRGFQLLKCHNNWKTTTLKMKSSVVQEFLSETHAPADLRQWAALTWAADGESEPSAGSSYLIRGYTVLLTYQGDFGVFDEATLPPPRAFHLQEKDEDPYVELVSRLRKCLAVSSLWEEFLAHVANLKRRFSCENHAASCEVCTGSWNDHRRVRVHFHLVLKHNSCMQCKARDLLLWKNVGPHVSGNVAFLQQRTGHGWAGLYYLTAPKFGSIFSVSSKQPFDEFPVNPDWVMTMVAGEKMALRVGREQMIRCGKGLNRRLNDLERLAQARREIKLEARVREVQRHLESTALRFHQFPVVQQWLAHAGAPFQRRKPFLVLEGPSGVGKTEFIRALFGAARTLELNCASCGAAPDLRQMDPDKHRLVLFDEASPELVLKNRKLFQAPAALIDLGHSPTGMNVYRVWLNDAVLVVNSNRWSSDCMKQSAEDRAWLVANQVLVIVTGPMWDTSPPPMEFQSQ